MDCVLGPFPWLISCIWDAVEEEALSDPGGDVVSSELGRIVDHTAAGALKRESSLANSRLGRGRRDHCSVKLNAAMFPHER